MVVRESPSSADLFLVDCSGEIFIDCSTLAQGSLGAIGLSKQDASFVLPSSNNFFSQFDIVLRVGGLGYQCCHILEKSWIFFAVLESS